ncbi:MAG: pyridoxal-phosphate dependent enzyme [Bacteroidetes bacterium]|nr:pyridoxal-phosphate dependent enzyme [Bacteroidota bacterium]
MPNRIPNKEDIVRAHELIKPYINRTPVLTSATFNHLFSADLYFKCENFQKVGAFKSRGAIHALLNLPKEELKRGVGTHSSGNHAQALARAAKLFEIPAYIVMPENSPKVKIDAVKGYGGIITFCKPTLEARESTLKGIIERTGASEVHPYDNYDIIAGQATATKELIEEVPDLDIILCPVGGGGLLSGTALSTAYFSEKATVVACEPSGADDACRSFKAGKIIPSVSPNTIADGLLTSLGQRNFPIIQKYVNEIVTVSDETIIKAMKWTYERMKIVIEPSSAVPLAAIMEEKVTVQSKKVGILISGGNVDLKNLPFR